MFILVLVLVICILVFVSQTEFFRQIKEDTPAIWSPNNTVPITVPSYVPNPSTQPSSDDDTRHYYNRRGFNPYHTHYYYPYYYFYPSYTSSYPAEDYLVCKNICRTSTDPDGCVYQCLQYF